MVFGKQGQQQWASDQDILHFSKGMGDLPLSRPQWSLSLKKKKKMRIFSKFYSLPMDHNHSMLKLQTFLLL